MDTGTPAGSGSPVGGQEISSDDRMMAMLAHILGIFTGVIGPLIIWLIKKDQSRFVDDQGKEALNFQIAALLAYAVLWIASIVTLGIGFLLTGPLMLLVWVGVIVFCILAGVAANNGQYYRYPVTLRLIK